MLNEILLSILKTVIAFVLLVVSMRILGRKAIAQMTHFDLAVIITLGSVTANVGMGESHSFYSTVTVLITISLLGLLSGIVHIKSFRFRKLINSEPLVIIKDGQIQDANMRKGRLTINELNAMLRYKNIFNISDVHYAVMEVSGDLSVLPKADKKPLTPSDMQMKPAESGLTRDIVVDGNIMRENLSCTNMTEEWLLAELKSNGIDHINDVFYAGFASNGSLYISKRTYAQKEKPGQYGIE